MDPTHGLGICYVKFCTRKIFNHSVLRPLSPGPVFPFTLALAQGGVKVAPGIGELRTPQGDKLELGFLWAEWVILTQSTGASLYR